VEGGDVCNQDLLPAIGGRLAMFQAVPDPGVRRDRELDGNLSGMFRCTSRIARSSKGPD
jgi:hypothetical protein